MDGPEEDTHIHPIQLIDRARTRLALATRADEKRAEAASRRDETERLKRRTETERQAANDELDACFEGQGGQDHAPRERVAKLVERDRLRTVSVATDHDRQKARDGVDDDLFVEELAQMPDATRAPELEQALQDAQLTRDTARDASAIARSACLRPSRASRSACDAACNSAPNISWACRAPSARAHAF